MSAMNPSVCSASNTANVRQIAPSTQIVLSAEVLTSLLMMNAASQAGQLQQTPTSSMDINSQILHLVAEQAAGQAVTLSMDPVTVPAVTELSGGGMAMESVSNDLDVGAQEMVSDEGTATQKQHPLHL